MNRLNSAEARDVATAIGVDVIGGFRDDYSDVCGSSRHWQHVFVWQQNNSGCQDDEAFTFAHEFGHVLHATHSDATAESGPPYRRTLMSSPSSESRILHFSNPEVDYPGTSTATGSTSSNNAEHIANNAQDVASQDSYVAPSGGRYTELNVPVRVLDTRSSEGNVGGYTSIGPGVAAQISVAVDGIPAGASSVVMNVAVISSTNDDAGIRIAANSFEVNSSATHESILFKPHDTKAQTVVVPLSIYKTVWMKTSADTVEVVVDVLGYFGPSGRYLHPVDTTLPASRVFNSAVGTASTSDVSVAGICGSSSYAALVNITVVNPSSNGYLVARGFSNPHTTAYATMNYGAGEKINNATFVELDSQKFKIYTLRSMSALVVDVVGCFRSTSSGGEQYTSYAVPSLRRTTTLSKNQTRWITALGGNHATVLGVLRVTNHTGSGGFIKTYPAGGALPVTSTINLNQSDRTSNLFLTESAPYNGTNRFFARRDNVVTATTYVSFLQLGYFS